MSSTLFNSLTHNSRKAWLVPPWWVQDKLLRIDFDEVHGFSARIFFHFDGLRWFKGG
jgi:hypothetical protein